MTHIWMYFKEEGSLKGDYHTWFLSICILVSAPRRAIAPLSSSSRACRIWESFLLQSRSIRSFSFFRVTTSSSKSFFSRECESKNEADFTDLAWDRQTLHYISCWICTSNISLQCFLMVKINIKLGEREFCIHLSGQCLNDGREI